MSTTINIAGNPHSSKKLNRIPRLTKSQIIPTVLDPFTPLLTLSISWPNATAKVGKTIDPAKLQSEPEIEFLDSAPASSFSDFAKKEKHPQLTLALTDPDAPSREKPDWSQICHWIITDIPLSPSATKKKHKMKTVMPYKPPGPPPKTGKHRYVFVALAPKNGTEEGLDLVKPGDRQHWGYEGVGKGVREWAEEMGLGVVGEFCCVRCGGVGERCADGKTGANFVYAENEEQ